MGAASSTADIQFSVNTLGVFAVNPCVAISNGSPIQLNSNTWYHVAGWYDGLRVTVSVNGVVRATTYCPNGPVIPTPSAPFVVGAADASGTNYFAGQIDELRVRPIAAQSNLSSNPTQFPGSALLTAVQQNQLANWIGQSVAGGNQYQWKLCYRRSIHGAAATTFHSLCDGLGPGTVAIVKMTNGKLLGGYTNYLWTSAGTFSGSDPGAFLFSFTTGTTPPQKKYPFWGPSTLLLRLTMVQGPARHSGAVTTLYLQRHDHRILQLPHVLLLRPDPRTEQRRRNRALRLLQRLGDQRPGSLLQALQLIRARRITRDACSWHRRLEVARAWDADRHCTAEIGGAINGGSNYRLSQRSGFSCSGSREPSSTPRHYQRLPR